MIFLRHFAIITESQLELVWVEFPDSKLQTMKLSKGNHVVNAQASFCLAQYIWHTCGVYSCTHIDDLLHAMLHAIALGGCTSVCLGYLPQ